MEEISNRLANGDSLVKICKSEDMPSYRTVTRAVQGDEEMWDLYRRGRVLQAEYHGL